MKIRVVSRLRRSRVMRLATAAALAGQCLSVTPVFAQDAARATVRATTRAASDAKRRVAKARVRVNRTVPTVTPPNLDPMFGTNVTTEALMRARFFPEQLIPTSAPTPDDNAPLARTLERIAISPADRWGAILDAHIQDHPTSPWRASLVATAGTLYARAGYFSRAASYWTQAWEMTRDSDDPKVKVLADYALGESIVQMAKFGQVERLESRLKETEGREFRGAPGTKVEDGWEALRMLREKHHMALFSGPEALKMYLTVRAVENLETAVRTIAAYHPSFEGTSMTELKTLGASVGLHLSMWRASSIEEFPVPSIVHLRSQHFSAIVETKDGKYRLRDPGLGGDIWMPADALRDETTGFVLAPSRPAGDEWRAVTDGEGQAAIGHCQAGKPSSDDPPCPNCGGGGPGGGGGMPYYSFHPTGVGLVIEDAPLGYAPPVGPDMSFRLAYNHRDYKTPNTFGYGNVGPLWTFNNLSYVIDNATMVLPPYTIKGVYLRGHGFERYTSYDPVHNITGAELVEVSHDPPRYERRLRDGSVEVFTQPDRAASLPERRIFLTEAIDPQGHTISYTYDSSFRLVSVADALGQVTTFAYEHGSDPNLLTKVTDPFGRFATLGYDAQGRLNSLTDAAGMTSTFTYGNSDFIVAMTTPYGTTTFRHEPSSSTTAVFRAIEAMDPVGGRERLEFHLQNNAFAETAPSSEVPTGFSGSNWGLHLYNSFYWDKLAMAQHPGDYAYAVNTNWMLAMDVSYGHPQSRPIPHSIKRPLENRVWYRYPGQSPTNSHSLPSVTQPALVGRVLDGGASQVTTTTYNSKWMVTSRIDPAGRQTNYTYASNGLDLQTVEQVRSGGTDVLQAYSNYTNHLPGTITDAAGQDTDFTYNSAGQLLTATNAKNETTTYTYETGTNNLLTVTRPVTGATTTYTHDAYNRVESVEDADGYIAITDYDNLNRPTLRTYPDDTTETFTYSRLDLTEQKDRRGRITRYFYDGFGRRVATRDPAGRTIAQQWCDCGILEALVDPKGNRTSWERDARGRVTREIRADNTTDTLYTYDLAGRLKTITDPKDQVTTLSYNIDDSLSGTAYTNEQISTSDVSYTYDPYYSRVATMVDGIGTTTYTYKATGTNGAGRVATIDGPLTDDTISYTYDELGRVVQRTINGSANQVDWTFDALGRVTSEENLLGEFTYTYEGVTSRLATVTYPNSQTSNYSYYSNAGDRRLQTIHHKYPNASTLSKFDYTYDAVGNILTWRQQADSTAVLWKYGYDQADQLISAVKHATDTPQTVLQRYAYAYDAAGNRTVEQIDDAVTLSVYDILNRLTSQAPGGPMVIAGTLNEPATVTISGKPAIVDANNNFRGTMPTTTGTNTFTIVAKDASGNSTTQYYEVDLSGTARSFTHDANGNLLTDGSRVLTWDAADRLVSVERAGSSVELSYDGFGQQRTRVVMEGAVETSHQQIVWCGAIRCELRDASASLVESTFQNGTVRGSTEKLTTGDHLGSVRDVTVGGAIESRYEYDPYGRPMTVTGTVGDAAFTSHPFDGDLGAYVTLNRQYDAELGRWLSEDPLGPDRLVNGFSYVRDNPIGYVDPLGLVELRWNERKRYGDPDIICGTQTGGACARAQAAAIATCEELSCGEATMKTILIVNSQITIWNGLYPYKGRKPADLKVKDRSSAYEHELTVHLHPATSAAMAILSIFEQRTYPSLAACQAQTAVARGLALDEFKSALALTRINDQ